MTTFILIHGMWHGGWCWEKLTSVLRPADLAKWLEGKWQPVELAGTLVTALASDKVDALRRGWISPEDDKDKTIHRIEEVENDELYVWSPRSFKIDERKID